jgi:ornithine cyclodeaminase
MLILSESQVASVLDYDLAIDAVARGLSALSRGAAIQPVRAVLRGLPGGSLFGVMPACLPEAPALGLKAVTLANSNLERGLPTHQACILLVDPRTGIPVALMDGRLITEVRTAAASAVATRTLAPPGASVLALLGSGVQARSHLRAIQRVRKLSDVRVWSPSPANRETFAAKEGAAAPYPVRAVGSAREAVDGADIVVTATASPTPVLEEGWLKPGAHINAVGSATPAARELSGPLVGACRIWLDSAEAAWREAGDLILARQEGLLDEARVVGELGALVAGLVPGRQSGSEITLFKSLGVAVEDVATATAVMQRAQERGVGLTIDLSA